MRKTALPFALVSVCLVAGACSKETPKSAAPAATASQAPAAAPAAGASTSLAVADGDFGVPECDSFMKKYLACIDGKVPEMARAPLKQGLDQQKAGWKQIAATPQGKTALANACTQAEASAKQSMAAYSCQW